MATCRPHLTPIDFASDGGAPAPRRPAARERTDDPHTHALQRDGGRSPYPVRHALLRLRSRRPRGRPAASFGIWHEYLDDVKTIAKRHDLHLTRLHSHIGSGTDPEVWKRVTRMTLDLAAKLPEVRSVNLGGGFKVGRMPGEMSVDLDD